MTYTYTNAIFDFLSYQIPVALCMTIIITSPLMLSFIPTLWNYWAYSLFFVFIWFCFVLMWFALDVVALSVVYAAECAFKKCQSVLNHNNKGTSPDLFFR